MSYVCSGGEEGEELFFEWDRDMAEYNVSCLEGGAWDQPAVWPVCLPCKCRLQIVYFDTKWMYLN